MRIYNWLLKQIFYFQYLVLKQDKSPRLNSIIFQPGNCYVWNSFENWRQGKPDEWDTRGIFSQQYGKFYFKAKLDGLVTSISQPAIWLYDEKSLADIQGNAEHPYYYEIDIELFFEHFGYTIWWNHNGGQRGATVVRSLFANRKLYRKLQKEYHLFLIDWSEKWIRFYINGILTACFKNEIYVPMQIICTKINMTKVIVQSNN
jgi:beta-glucanase (GH16 family)